MLMMEKLQYLTLGALLFTVVLFFISSTFKFTVKYVLYHLYMIFIFALALIPCCFRPGSAHNIIIGKHLVYASRFVWWLFGFNIITEGADNLLNLKAPCVFMCNHQSSLDALVIAKVGNYQFDKLIR